MKRVEGEGLCQRPSIRWMTWLKGKIPTRSYRNNRSILPDPSLRSGIDREETRRQCNQSYLFWIVYLQFINSSGEAFYSGSEKQK